MPATRPDPQPDFPALLHGATQRLVRTVDALSDEDWAAPSLLPGWTRAHVVAHLTLNAEAFAEALDGIRASEPVPMYPSQTRRDGDIEQLALEPVPLVRDRFLAASTRISESLDDFPEELLDATFERVPGGRLVPAGNVSLMRLLEVEIHHADLGASYTSADWPVEFVTHLLTRRSAQGAQDTGFTAYAVDLDRSFVYGDGGPTVSGTAAALAWWTTGRGSGAGLTSDDGTLPGIEGM